MSKYWVNTTWGDAVELKYGKAIRGYQNSDEKYPVYGTNGQVGWHSDFLDAGPGVILGRKGAYRGVHYCKEPFFVIDTAYYVKPKSKFDMRWLYYAMQHYKLGQIDDGSPIPSTTRAAVYSSEFKYPPFKEQKFIAECLGALDDKIDLNRQMNETLEEMARALFRDWFIDFGPTLRQMDGATDPAAIMGYAFPNNKAAALAPLFPVRLGEDGLPERWSFSDVGSEFDVVMGQSPPGDTYNEAGHGFPFFQGRRDFGFRFPSRRVYCTKPKRVSGHDWTLLSVRAPVGDINRAAEMCAIGRGVGAFLHKDILHSFTYYTGLALRTELQSYDKDGTVFGSINQKQFKSLKVVRPTDGLAYAFDQIIQPVDEKIRANTEENQTLAEIRDLLLPKLMSGEIHLQDGETQK